MNGKQLSIGFGVVDITPPRGVPMCGSLDVRINEGVDDPLMAKALVAEGETGWACIVGLDLVNLPGEIANKAIDKASQQTGIDREAIMLSCSHTHSGPYTSEGEYHSGVANDNYLQLLPDLIASSIETAYTTRQPAVMSIGRSLVHHGLHYRRVVCQDGKALNTWMRNAVNDLDSCPQVAGAGGPIDPEMWVLRFDDTAGNTLGFLVNFSCHANTHPCTTYYSADYPGVIAEYLQADFGSEVVSVFTPGACGNINAPPSNQSWREVAEWFASQAVNAAHRTKRIDEPIPVDALRRDVSVPRRDPESQPPEAIGRLNWGGKGGREDVFQPMLERMASMPEEVMVPINVARLGPFAIASNPGELFVESGLHIKRRSPFPHTVVAELTNDQIGYEPTREAFDQQGYETLVGANRVSIEGIETILDSTVELLKKLWTRGEK